MTLSSSHIIRQQYLHATMEGSESEGLALQHSLSEWCCMKMTPVIERVLDRASSPDVHICIERVEIDVGDLNLARLEHDLAEAVGQALEKQISKQILHPGITTQPPTPGNIRYLTAQDSINKALIHFLTTGSLPWSFRLPAGQNLEQAVLEAWQEAAGSGAPPLNASDFIPLVRTSETVRKRLIRQFSPRFLMTMLSLLAPDARMVLDKILQSLHAAALPLAEIKEFEESLREIVFEYICAGKALSAAAVVKQAWSALPVDVTERPALVNLVESHWPGTNCRSATADAAGVTRNDGRDSVPPGSILPSDSGPADGTRPEPAWQAKTGSPTQAGPFPSEKSEVHKRQLDPARHPDVEEGIYIENAGLVLLHPFLPRFFTALGIASEERLVLPGRALCLLHFLATGQPVAPEYELMLPKILCNLPLDTPVEADVSLTAAELEEAAALLQAVIHHWDALRNTSADGLRGTFLLRPGKLSLRNSDWLLQVESKSFDILLDQLPWGISMIKLPWMEKLLWVEWS